MVEYSFLYHTYPFGPFHFQKMKSGNIEKKLKLKTRYYPNFSLSELLPVPISSDDSDASFIRELFHSGD